MKKLLFLSASALIFTLAVNAQSSETSTKSDRKEERKEARKNEVGFQPREEFYRNFGNVPVTKWERLGNLDKATFTKDGETTFAFFDYNAELIGTTTTKTFAQLPTKTQEYIKDKYKDYDVKDVLFFDDNEYNETDMELYGVQFTTADNYFVELKKDDNEIVLQSTPDGDVFFFRQIK